MVDFSSDTLCQKLNTRTNDPLLPPRSARHPSRHQAFPAKDHPSLYSRARLVCRTRARMRRARIQNSLRRQDCLRRLVSRPAFGKLLYFSFFDFVSAGCLFKIWTARPDRNILQLQLSTSSGTRMTRSFAPLLLNSKSAHMELYKAIRGLGRIHPVTDVCPISTRERTYGIKPANWRCRVIGHCCK